MYGKFLKRSAKPKTAIDGANELSALADTDNKYVKYTVLKVIKDNVLKSWQEKEDSLKVKIEKAKTDNTDSSAISAELKIATETKNKISEIYNSIKK